MISVNDVFGVRTDVSEYSYIDRGNLDKTVSDLSKRNQHIALRGESKSGKSWLRQKIFQSANIIQCRINDTVQGIYRQVLANLQVTVVTEHSSTVGGGVAFEGTAEAGWGFLAKAAGTISANGEYAREKVTRPIGRDELDIEFICGLVKASGKRLVIEDFHYLSHDEQRQLAHDLKTLWDYGVYVVIVGVWHRKNYLNYLNSDLAGRIAEVSVEWSNGELEASFRKGCAAIKVSVDEDIVRSIAQDSYNNIGILQSLALNFMDACGVTGSVDDELFVDDRDKLADAGMAYADQLEAVYSLFAERVSEGIRKRKNATQIYAVALWSILDADDANFISGLSLDWVYQKASARQPRIQKPNLRSVLRKFKSLQEDDRGKGVVVSFDDATETVILIDKGVLFYRKYSTQTWPWERIAIETRDSDVGLDGED